MSCQYKESIKKGVDVYEGGAKYNNIWKEKLSTMHGHTYYEFAICNKGEIIHYLNDDESRRLKKGQAFFITPEDRHANDFNAIAFWITISGKT